MATKTGSFTRENTKGTEEVKDLIVSVFWVERRFSGAASAREGKPASAAEVRALPQALKRK